ncbi:DUF1642 domain-containing protein [Enterococcus devriesei]
MNKQELIEKYEAEKNEILAYQNSDSWKDEGVLQKKASVTALEWVWDFIEDLKQLDEPQKVKVPQFGADWIEQAKEEDRTLFEVMDDIYGSCYYHKGDDETYKWLFGYDESPENQKTFAKAYLDGYEVEEEPKWIVCYSTMYLKSPLETGQIESVEITPKKELAYHFKSYKEAKQQTSLIGGTVEKAEV